MTVLDLECHVCTAKMIRLLVVAFMDGKLMARRNPLEKALDHVTDDFRRRLISVKSSNAVPLGEEEVSPSEFRSRFAEMSEFDRKRVLDEKGQAEVLRQLRGA